MRFLVLNGFKFQSKTSCKYGQQYGGPPLYVASATGLVWTVKQLLASGVNANERGGVDSCAQTSSTRYYQEFLFEYLNKLREIKGRNENFNHGNALIAACCGGREEIVQVLLDNGAEVNVQFDNDSGNALHAACHKSNEGIVRMLIEKGADVNAKGARFQHPLVAACRQKTPEIVRMLLERGADANARGDDYDGYALHTATYWANEQIVDMLIGADADVNAEGGHDGYALHHASFGANTCTVQLLLNAGADVNARGGHYGTALHSAAFRRGADNIAKMLLNHGADPNIQNGAYGCALGAAGHWAEEGMTRVLLEGGADPDLVCER